MKNKNAVMLLASIMSFRMLGLFMILPIFSVSAESLVGATPKLIGLALGIYGLTQAALQLPLGFLSDHFGRKRVIFAGLCIFLAGSILGANAHTMQAMIVARALQGAGAIGSTILAFVSDLTSIETRTKAMAMIGMSIGFSFTIAMMIGPVINHYFSLAGIFWLTAALSCLGIFFLTLLPSQQSTHITSYFEEKTFRSLLFSKSLVMLNVSIFALHALLTAMFIAIPILLTHQLLLSNTTQIVLYFIILILSFAIAIPFIVIAEKHGKIRTVFFGAVALILSVECFLLLITRDSLASRALFFVSLLLFFIAFTALEALLPSMVSKIISPQKKGAAMGFYSTSQFLGIFAGGALGGVVYAQAGIAGIFSFCTTIAAVWFLLVWKTKQ